MKSFKLSKNIASWTVFTIALIVYFFSAERTGSLWDCGEFILGALKLQVVHPPGAPLFVLVGRLFTWFAEILSSNPADIAFAVNLMSGMCTAFAAFFITRITMMFAKPMVTVAEETNPTQNIILLLAGLVAGLSTAFCSSIWFSAVEGEVYAMSTMFTALTFWAATKWYFLPDTRQADRWLLASIYFGALSIGVHLLSILTFPAIGLMFYFKKFKNRNILGALASLAAGAGLIVFIQKFVIVGIPTVWKNFEMMLVNGMGMPFHSGAVLTVLLLAVLAVLFLRFAHIKDNYLLQFITMAGIMCVIGFSTIGVVVIRANADTPVNMNVPSDVTRLLPYLNREQYGERPLLFGPHFDAKPKEIEEEDRYGRVGDKYEIVDRKLDYVYAGRDKMFLPRIGHSDPGRPQLHREWYKAINGKDMKGKPKMGYNLQYMFAYQMGWMYFRYFMWNFSGRQNGAQGYKPWIKTSGHWLTGIKPIDEMRLYNLDSLTDNMKNHRAYNKYYMLPFIFGLIGFFFMALKRFDNFAILLFLFLITGLGIIMYSNQPPNEPRERDYVLVGSFMTYCIWIGMSVVAIAGMIAKRMKNGNTLIPGVIAGALVLIAPLLMGFQNFDDHTRKHHYGSRDYASNFLNSVEPNSIIFTYGDNDTYPLWYAQEVENIRTDVRVVNLSLIAVDWYIEKLRKKVNQSPALNLTLPSTAYRGNKRNQVFFYNPNKPNDPLMDPINIFEEFKFIGSANNETRGQTISRTRSLYIPVNKQKAIEADLAKRGDSSLVDRINIKFKQSKTFIQKDELAIMDVLISNMYDRPIYFAVTCKNDKLLGLNDYMSLEGLALRLTATKNKSDKSLAIFGSGKVDTDKAFTNMTEKWRWGNFDKQEAFIDDSYAAEIQAMKLTMMRTANELLKKGEMQKAKELSLEFLEAFPNFNFPYDNTVVPFMDNLIIAGDLDSAKKYIRILAEEMRQKMVFYESLDDDDIEAGFQSEFAYTVRAVSEILGMAKETQDPDFQKEMDNAVGQYDYSKIRKN